MNVGTDKYLQVGLSYPVVDGAGHTIVYDLSSTSKSLLNNAVQTTTLTNILANYQTQTSIVTLEPNLSSSIYPASVSGNCCNIYALTVGSGCLTVTLNQPLTQGAGHTVSYDVSDSLKNLLGRVCSVDQLNALQQTLNVNGVYRNVSNTFSEANTFNNNVVISSNLTVNGNINNSGITAISTSN